MRAVFFDANGVLYFRAGQHQQLRSLLARHGLPTYTSDDIWHFKDAVRRQLAPDTPRRAREEALLALCGVETPTLMREGRQALAADAAAITVFDGVPGTLQELRRRGFRLGVITNTSVTTTEKLAWLRTHDVDVAWDAFVSSSEVGMRKPDAAIYRRALEQARVRAPEAVFVGHAADELAGAQAIGMWTVACHPDADAVADVTIATFAALLTLPELTPASDVTRTACS